MDNMGYTPERPDDRSGNPKNRSVADNFMVPDELKVIFSGLPEDQRKAI